MQDKDNIKHTPFGYEITWTAEESYGGKILVFDKLSKTDFWFNNKTEKSWFVNNGSFVFRWIDTATGQVFEREASEGFVFTAKPLVPCAIQCTVPGSIAEVNNGTNDDHFIVVKKESY